MTCACSIYQSKSNGIMNWKRHVMFQDKLEGNKYETLRSFLPQLVSSEPSPQSLSVSQSQVRGMHRWLAQLNWSAWHVPGVCVGQSRSSLPSKQSLCPSQRQFLGTQRWLAQVKAEEEQVLSEEWNQTRVLLIQKQGKNIKYCTVSYSKEWLHCSAYKCIEN